MSNDWKLDHDPFKQLLQSMSPALPKHINIPIFKSDFLPRKGDIVVDQYNCIGKVESYIDEGVNRFLNIVDEYDTLIYIRQESDFFKQASTQEFNQFNTRHKEYKNIFIGGIYQRKGYFNCPMILRSIELTELGNEIYKFEQYNIGSTKKISLRNTKDFEFIDFGLGNWRNFKFLLNEEYESLEWKIETSIVKTGKEPCALNVGSPFSFRNFKTAQKELEKWKSIMFIKRVASILNDGWIPLFKKNEVNFYIELKKNDGIKYFEVGYTDLYNNQVVYFKNIEIAVCATELISVGVYEIATGFLQLE